MEEKVLRNQNYAEELIRLMLFQEHQARRCRGRECS